MISKFIFLRREKGDPSVDDAGAEYPTKIWSGKGMERFNVNMARSFLGKNVNLHLKDGSVIINVQFSELLKDEFKSETFVKYVPFGKSDEFRISLRNIAWAERLNLILV